MAINAAAASAPARIGRHTTQRDARRSSSAASAARSRWLTSRGRNRSNSASIRSVSSLIAVPPRATTLATPRAHSDIATRRCCSGYREFPQPVGTSARPRSSARPHPAARQAVAAKPPRPPLAVRRLVPMARTGIHPCRQPRSSPGAHAAPSSSANPSHTASRTRTGTPPVPQRAPGHARTGQMLPAQCLRHPIDSAPTGGRIAPAPAHAHSANLASGRCSMALLTAMTPHGT